MERIRKGDTVVVIAGKNKGQRGKVLRLVDSKGNRADRADRVVVERVAMVKKHIKPSQKNPQGGIVEREGSIHLSNVMLLDPGTDKPTRVKIQVDKESGQRRRVGKSGTVIEAAK